MTESSSTTKRLKTSEDDDPESLVGSKTIVSLNKITLVPSMISPASSPIKQTSASKMSFIDSLTKKVNISPTQTNPATTTTTNVGGTSGASKRILTITSSNGTSISPSAFASSLNGNENKIQYVKIVNSSTSTKDGSLANSATSGVKLTSVCSAVSASSSTSTCSATQVSILK